MEEIRAAATVVVVRGAEGSPGVEVLVLQRSKASRFAPGYVVFPGGAVDPGDDALAERWFGAAGERARACAIRELAEETGLLAAADGLVAAAPRGGPRASGMETPAVAAFRPPSADRLPEIGRWIAPSFLPVRFDARFFAVDATSPPGRPATPQPIPDGVEAARAWWTRPEDVLFARERGEATLAWPTLKTLEALAGCADVDEVLRLRVEQVPPPEDWPPRPTRGSAPAPVSGSAGVEP